MKTATPLHNPVGKNVMGQHGKPFTDVDIQLCLWHPAGDIAAGIQCV